MTLAHLHPRATMGDPVQTRNPRQDNALPPILSRSCANVAAHPKSGAAAHLAIIASLPAMELRARYPKEATAHRGMLRREKAGIRTVAAPWRDLRTFLLDVVADIGPHPGGDASLDRKNNADPEYGPGKVRWATKREQSLNRTTTLTVRGARGAEVPAIVIAAKRGISAAAVRRRLERGWTAEDAVTLAKGVRRPKRAAPTEEAAPAGAPAPQRRNAPGGQLEAAWHVWRAAWSDAFRGAPDALPWGGRERGQARQLLARIEATKADPLDFLRHAVTHHRDVLANQLGWMRGPAPALPALGFIARHLDAYFDHYASRRMNEAHARMGGEAEYYTKLRASGMDHAEAIAELAVSRERARQRETLDAKRRAVADAYRALQAERQALQRRATVAPPRPHHRPLHERVDPRAWEGIEVDPEAIVDLSRLGLEPWR